MSEESPELVALRQKLAAIESEIEGNKARIAQISGKQKWLGEQRSECLKCISKLTIAKPVDEGGQGNDKLSDGGK